MLDCLLQTIRVSETNAVETVVALIRENGSLQEIADAVGCKVTEFKDSMALSAASRSISDEGDNDPDAPSSPEFKTTHQSGVQFSSPWSEKNQPAIDKSPATAAKEPILTDQGLTKTTSRPTLDPYARVSISSLCDVPLFEVKAKPWTMVTDNDELVAHLISLYFTWEHPCAQFVDQGIFLEHMQRGQLDSEFCSPFLVNSILSMSSVWSPYLPIMSYRMDPNNADIL